MISLPTTESLLPQQPAANLYTLRSDTTPIVRIEWIDEAGTAYQPVPACASAAARLHTVASQGRKAEEVAEWLDYRGIHFEHSPAELGSSVVFYTLRRYAEELISLVAELRSAPSFPDEELALFRTRRNQLIRAGELNPTAMVRRLFCAATYGEEHPLGRYGRVGDSDALQREQVMRFFAERYAAPTLLLSGQVDDALVRHASSLFPAAAPLPCIESLAPARMLPPARAEQTIDGVAQTALRIGRVLPMDWNSEEYGQMLILTTLLGGYFGSRLMQNLRQEKGYTYGIQARTLLYRGSIGFIIHATVAPEVANQAEEEVRKELQQLCDTPVSHEELETVKTVFVGDFLRTVDGIFERAERLNAMLQARVDERLTDWQRLAITSATPQSLQKLAAKWLQPESMTYCRAGA